MQSASRPLMPFLFYLCERCPTRASEALFRSYTSRNIVNGTKKQVDISCDDLWRIVTSLKQTQYLPSVEVTTTRRHLTQAVTALFFVKKSTFSSAVWWERMDCQDRRSGFCFTEIIYEMIMRNDFMKWLRKWFSICFTLFYQFVLLCFNPSVIEH